MSERSANDWLEQWAKANLSAAQHPHEKSDVQAQARRCAEEATAAGLTIAQLKEAAGGDLEAFLLGKQNAREGGANG